MVPGWMWTLDSVKNVQFRAVGGKSGVVFTSLCDRHHQHLSQSLFKIMRMDMCDWQPSALKINKPLSKKHGWQKIFRVFPWWAHRLVINTALNWILGQQNSQIWFKGWHVWGDLHVKGCVWSHLQHCSPTDMDLQGFRTADTFRDKQVESAGAPVLIGRLWSFLGFILKLEGLHLWHPFALHRHTCTYVWSTCRLQASVHIF